MRIVKKRIFVVASVALVGVCLWLGMRGSDAGHSRRMEGNASRHSGSMDSSDAHGTAAVLKTKSAIRDTGTPRATHGPERLKEFYLPAVDINELTLREALAKLMTAYEDACAKADEVPIRLTFDVPPAATKKLRLKLSPGNFNSSVRLLATYAGMKVNRDKTVYRFEPFADDRRQVKRSIPVPPDFSSRLSEQAGLNSRSEWKSPFDESTDPAQTVAPSRLPIVEIIRASGVELELETSNGADAAAIAALADTLAGDLPIQNKFTTKILHIPADLDWTPPDISQMSEPEVQLFMRNMVQKRGVDLMTMPAATGRNDQSAKIEVTRELIAPTNEEGTAFEKHDVGVVMQVKSNALGFGNDVNFDFTVTTGNLDPSGKKVVIQKETDISDSGYANDSGTRFALQTRPDGSHMVVLLTATMIDATGRSLRGTE
jgi:hypothetical protein